MPVHQILGMILESRVVQKLSLETNVFTKNWSSKLIFFFKKFISFLTSKIDFESTILALFDSAALRQFTKNNIFLETHSFFDKIKLIMNP